MNDPEPEYNVEMPKPNKWKLPDLSYGPSAEIPCFSSAVTLAHDKDLGRHLIADQDLNTGLEIIKKVMNENYR
jgi:hypothetical protein